MRENPVFTATVIESVPQLCAAVVIPTAGVGDLRGPLLAYMQRSDSGFGAEPTYVLPSGCTVLCTSGLADADSVTRIIGVLSMAMDPMLESYLQRARSTLPEVLDWNGQASDFRLLEKLLPGGSHVWARNHTYGLDPGAFPGDCDIVDRQGLAGLHVGRNLASLCGGPLASVEVSSAEASVAVTGREISEHTVMSERMNDGELQVDNRALTVSEAFGLPSGNPFKPSDDGEGIQPVKPGALPLYRLQSLSGTPIAGRESSVLGFPIGAEAHGKDQAPPVLSRLRHSATGSLTAASARGTALVKTPWIPAVLQLGYGEELETEGELRIPFKPRKRTDEEPVKAPDDGRLVDDAMLNRLADRLLSEDYADKLREVLASHGLSVAGEKSSVFPESDSRPIGGTAGGEPSYPLPERTELEDPVTGDRKACYLSTSMITQEPDGSICLCDGYGSEIRMSRGNIYISPALDLFVRPGRDVSVMAPRHQSYNSQATCTINTSGSMHIRSVGDLLAAGATGGRGTVSLESMAKSGTDGSGLMLKSMADLSLTCTGDMYIGRNAHDSDAEGLVNTPYRPGAIIMDSGSLGSVCLRGRTFTADSGESVIGGFTEAGSGSALLVTPGSMALLTDSVAIPANVSLAPCKGNASVSVTRNGTVEDMRIITGTGSLAIGGDLLIGGGLVSNGAAVFNKGLAANGVASISQYCSVIPKKDREKQFRHQPAVPSEIGFPVGGWAAGTVREAASGVYQDRFLSERGFHFPSDYKVSLGIMPGMLWQARSEESGSPGESWHEQPFESPSGDISACYPGYGIWKSASLSFPGYETRDLESGYVTNSEKWETEE